MRFIAFYLPQFHPIKENDAIYGPGFTEWDNVRAAKPLFFGHYEPHIPHKCLGYYSLLDANFLRFQHDLALNYGVQAFCYYYYNFGGHTLLKKPLTLIRRAKEIRNSYCCCWVHTDWYDNRKAPNTPFLQQHYSPKNAIALFLDLLPFFEDDRYIKINNAPLLLIWAPERHPLLPVYSEILRNLAHRHGFPNLYLAGVEAYCAMHPLALGLDGMVEFAPDWLKENHVSAPDERPVRIDYTKTIQFMLGKPLPDYQRMRCTFPGWDNTPRRGSEGIACVNLNQELFQQALEKLVLYTNQHLPEQLHYVFINAWNEWGEGCHLEPDVQNGFAYLNCVRAVAQTST